MVKSPVEGNSVVLLKMDEPLVFSDFARPICIPDKDDFVDQDSKCVTLGTQSQDDYKFDLWIFSDFATFFFFCFR